jgi:hypothetical protein
LAARNLEAHAIHRVHMGNRALKDAFLDCEMFGQVANDKEPSLGVMLV